MTIYFTSQVRDEKEVEIEIEKKQKQKHKYTKLFMLSQQTAIHFYIAKNLSTDFIFWSKL